MAWRSLRDNQKAGRKLFPGSLKKDLALYNFPSTISLPYGKDFMARTRQTQTRYCGEMGGTPCRAQSKERLYRPQPASSQCEPCASRQPLSRFRSSSCVHAPIQAFPYHLPRIGDQRTHPWSHQVQLVTLQKGSTARLTLLRSARVLNNLSVLGILLVIPMKLPVAHSVSCDLSARSFSGNSCRAN